MAAVNPVVLDFESFYSPTHSLSKMNAIEYVMHPETELISVSVKEHGKATDVTFGERQIRERLSRIDWRNTLAIAHNMSGFDALIMAFRLGIHPKMWGCTLSMARPIHAKTTGVSLAALVKHYGIGVKDSTALINTRGKHLKDFTTAELNAMRDYNAADTDQCYELFKRLLPLTGKQEMKLIDMTIRMLVEPQFQTDRDLLVRTLQEERKRKTEVLVRLGKHLGVPDGSSDEATQEAVSTVLSSAAKFSDFLRSNGVEVPMKASKTDASKMIPALAKTDSAFLEMLEHDDPLVSMAAAARLDAKSTLLESRLAVFIEVSDAVGGKLPIPLNYYGADTTGRWSGWLYNPQNLPRINPKKPKLSDALRMSLRAGHGKKVIVADLSGIELRVNHFLWKVPSSMALYQEDPEKADLYKDFASALYGISKDAVSKDQRQLGKVAHLGLGFGSGAETFRNVAKTMGGVVLSLDVEVPPGLLDAEGFPIEPGFSEWYCTRQLSAREVVDKWRAAYPEIVKGWKRCHKALDYVFAGSEFAIDPWGMCVTCREGIRTPKGIIRYPDLRKEVLPDSDKYEWVYGQGRNKARIYAGKITENIVQHLARGVIADYALEFAKTKMGSKYPLALCVHDELVYVCDEDDAEEALQTLQSIMRTPPKWWPELITWSEGDIADTYGEAK